MDGAVRERLIEGARACVGTAFRPQGRVLGVGLDCVGLVLEAARFAGIALPLVPPYRLGGDHEGRLEAVLLAFGCSATSGAFGGDILVTAPLPRRRHLGVLTPAGLVHAHAGLGRVVEGPLDPAWDVMGVWRLPGVE